MGWPEVARRMLAALEAPTITVDARYLKRAGIGVSVYLRGAIGRLRGAGVALVLLTDDETHAAALMREHVGANVRVVVLHRRSGFLWEQWDLPRYLRRTRPQAHLAGANYGLPLFPAGGARLMLVVHDLIPLRMPRAYLFNRPAWAAKYLLSVGIALWRASTVLVPSRATAQDVSRLLRRDKVRVRYPSAVVANGNEPAALPPDWPAEYLLYNGGFDPRKNVDGLLEAFALYRRSGGSHKLAILGEAPAGGLSAARRLGIEAELWLPGYVDDETRNAAVASAAAVVYPSRWEGFGLPVLEALTAGVPVVTGTGGSLREVGGDAVVYVDVRDPASIAAGISRAVTPSERRRLAPRAARQLRLLSTSAHDDPVLSFAP
jgi:glycosyltransferase involved in cell wall biosynthesis